MSDYLVNYVSAAVGKWDVAMSLKAALADGSDGPSLTSPDWGIGWGGWPKKLPFCPTASWSSPGGPLPVSHCSCELWTMRIGSLCKRIYVQGLRQTTTLVNSNAYLRRDMHTHALRWTMNVCVSTCILCVFYVYSMTGQSCPVNHNHFPDDVLNNQRKLPSSCDRDVRGM